MSETKHAILVVDDENANLQKLKRTFIDRYIVYEANSGEKAFAVAQREPIDLVITDQKMPRMTGIELLKRIMKIKPDVMRIILTGYTEVEDLIDAINEGHVYRYITKPWDPKEMRITVRQALETLELERENRRLTIELQKVNERLQVENLALRNEVRRYLDDDRIIYESRAMKEILAAANRVARADSTVLITGETGTGKELIARYIHKHSLRNDGIFVAVNCGAIPRDLAESEFFGFRKGAFTGASAHKKGYFQVADGGTLFLDEIGEAPPDLQVKMLRVLQNQEIWPVGSESPLRVNVRIIASTNRDLNAEVDRSRFREDLFFRLNVFSIRVPPLRERREDIRPLVEFFFERFQTKLNRKLLGIEPPVLDVLRRYDWPGNVRQLENEVERLVLLTEQGQTVRRDSISGIIAAAGPSMPESGDDASSPQQFEREDLDMKDNLVALETRLIRQALRRTGDNRTHAARLLNITRQSLLDRMKRYNIQ
ncbi:MAG: sigma-54-dependent Fis family transcriptional regulator [Acidobacteria bacterium]|nr:sigma-54-dependent Fis family transcriptional regulator [Acidobacteriota bacterium]